MSNNINHHAPIAASRIIVTNHAKCRAEERLGIRKIDEIRTEAARARNKGIRYNCVNVNNYEKLGLNYREFCSFMHGAKSRDKSERIYLHKGYIWVFRGNNALNLVTVFKMDLLDRIPEVQGELRRNLNVLHK